MEFPEEIIERMRWYVYLYIDPFTKKTFYIGQGKGNRIFDHLSDEVESKKTDKIKEIRRRGKEPRIELLRYGLSQVEATVIEASVIDFMGITNLTNKVRGKDSRTLGRVAVEDILIEFTAKPVKIRHQTILIKINKTFRSDMTSDELYEATRGVWVVGERRERVDLAFAVYHGVVKEVYKIHKWYPVGTLDYKYRDISNLKNENRWEFEGVVAKKIRELYVQKSVKDYLSQGSQNPIRYVNVQ